MRRLLGATLTTIGVIVALVAIAMATVWKPSGIVTATASTDAAFLRTEPGVLELVERHVTITATASKDADITLAFGDATDTAAWLDGLNAAHITGLKDWETLAVSGPASPTANATDTPTTAATPAATATSAPAETSAPADATPAPTESTTAAPAETSVTATATTAPAPDVDPNIAKLAGSDMWSKVVTGKGTVNVAYDVTDPGNVVLIAASSDGTAPKLTLSWQSTPDTSSTIPFLVVGLLIAAIGILVLLMQVQAERREKEQSEARKQRLARRASRAAAETSVLTKFDGDITETSRQIQTAATGRALGAGVFPASPRSEELRARTLSDEARLIIDHPEEEPESDSGSLDNASSDSDVVVDTSPGTAEMQTPASSWRQRWGLGNSVTETPDPSQSEPGDGTAPAAAEASDDPTQQDEHGSHEDAREENPDEESTTAEERNADA